MLQKIDLEPKSQSLFGITIHWIDHKSFQKISGALAGPRADRQILGSHTYDILAVEIDKIFNEYGIDAIKIVNATTDNAQCD